MKKFFTILVNVAMVAVMLPAGVSASTTNTTISNDGICAIVIKCESGENGFNCDSLQNGNIQVIYPGQNNCTPDTDTDTDTDIDIIIPGDSNIPSVDTDVVIPEQDNNTPSEDTDVIIPEQDNNSPSENYGLHEYELEVIRLVNEIRVENGLSELAIDTELSRVARIKSQDMKDNGYFSHTSPVYGSPFDMMKNFGISYKSAGENIAKGQTTPQAVVNAWMNSSGHRANILNASYNAIGVGYVAEGNYWTQMFIQK